jgi:ABC-2 type transport system ATP-binding protein
MSVLQVTSLRKEFGTFQAVNNISFSIKKGEILGLLGPNGAGKTTTIQMLLGALTPTSGSITYFGKELSSHRSEILQQVTFASAYVKLPSRLTIAENLDIFARMYGVPAHERHERIRYFLNLFGMEYIRNKYVGDLSAGQITRVMLAKAFIPKPKIILLDEPTASLDPDVAQEVRSFVLEQKKKEGLSVLFTSHNMDEVTHVCDRVLVLQHGTIIADNTPAQLASSIANARVHLFITQGMEKAIAHAQQHKLGYTVNNNDLQIEVEHTVAQLLIDLTRQDVYYSQISIDKPSLEDYFLHIAKQQTKALRK